MKYPDLDLRTIEAVVDKLGGVGGVRRLLQDEVSLVPLFTRNEHRHIVLTVTVPNDTIGQEIEALEAAGFIIGDCERSLLTSLAYNAEHRLASGQQYRIALMPTSEIASSFGRTSKSLRAHGIKMFGYEKAPAGVVLRVCEVLSAKKMKEKGFMYVAAAHDPIVDRDGGTRELLASWGDRGKWIHLSGNHPDRCWSSDGAFAFLVPTS